MVKPLDFTFPLTPSAINTSLSTKVLFPLNKEESTFPWITVQWVLLMADWPSAASEIAITKSPTSQVIPA